MDKELIKNEIKISKLFSTSNDLGSIFRIMRRSDKIFSGFGEVYITTIRAKQFKGWKKHKKNTTNLAVPFGEIKILVKDEIKNKEKSYVLSPLNYQLITIPPGYWFGMQNIANHESIIVNFSNYEHNPDEVISKDVNSLNNKI